MHPLFDQRRYLIPFRSSLLPQIFTDGKSPLEKFSLRDFTLDARGKELFCGHFSGLGPSSGADARSHQMRALRQFSIGPVTPKPPSASNFYAGIRRTGTAQALPSIGLGGG